MVTTSSSHSSRKYLCAAPRPDAWDDHADDVIAKLGDQAAEIIASTIDKIRSLHAIEPKIGPGRKSNAEHALHFYQYLLETIKRSEAKPKADAGDMTTDEEAERSDAEEEAGEETPEPRARVPLTAEQGLCDVCHEPEGEMITCDECHLRFHVPCSRPVIDEPPPKPWRCAYCILAHEPKNTKLRRAAAAAVRLMARLRNQHKRNKARSHPHDDHDVVVENETRSRRHAQLEQLDDQPSDEEVSGGVEEPKAADETDQKQEAVANDESKDEDSKTEANPATPTSSPRKRKLALYKIADSLSPALKLESPTDSGRGKRSRNPPTLYDPQTVPARKWQSDEFPESRRSGDEDDSSEEEDEEKKSSKSDSDQPLSKKAALNLQESRRAGRDRSSSVWCNFCNDDPSIQVCCFCACRVCFGKHHQKKLMLCDMCDDEYHTFCLEPPLTKVPSDKWFCPTCTASREKKVSRTNSRTRGVKPKLEREAPPTPRRSSSRGGSSAKKAESADGASVATSTSGRGPGRPRGRPAKRTPPSAGSGGKKRGRPSKSSSVPPPARKRVRTGKGSKSASPSAGRSVASNKSDAKKSVSISGSIKVATVLPRSVAPLEGRIVEAPYGTGSEAGQSDPFDEAATVKVSRSGRTVKRSAFHDEIAEGEQHLRAGRLEGQRRSPDATVSTDAGAESMVTLVSEPAAQPPASLTASLGPTAAGLANVKAPVAVTAKPVQPVTVPGGTTSVAATGAALPTTAAPSVPTPAGLPSAPSAPVISASAVASVKIPAPASMSAATAAALSVPYPAAAVAAAAAASASAQSSVNQEESQKETKVPRRKPGARECMQLSRRFGPHVIPDVHMETLLDYCKRGKVEHLIRMRERLDDHSRFLEAQLAGLEALVKEKGESNVKVPAAPHNVDTRIP